MREVPLTFPEIGMINITRFIIGTGAGLLLADKLDNKARKAVGLTMVTVGILFSIPVGIAFIGKLRGGQPQTGQFPDTRAA